MDTTEESTERDLVPAPGVRTILTPELSAALLRDNERQALDAAARDGRCSPDHQEFCADRVAEIDADIDHWRRMRQICALQDALPSGGVLCYSDGNIARLATIDLLRTEGTR